MASFAELFKAKAGPYSRPIRVHVVVQGNATTYYSNEVEKQMMKVAVTDGETVTKCIIYDPSKFVRFKQDNSVILRDIILRTEDDTKSIVVTKTSKVFNTSRLNMETQNVRHLQDVGQHLINPPAAEVVGLKEALSSPVKKKISVQGKVSQVDAVQNVNVRGQQVPIRHMYLSDDTVDKCKVTLWREASETNVQPGEYIKITDVVVNCFRNETALSTTTLSSVQKTELPVQEKDVSVVGISTGDNSVELLLDDDMVLTCEIHVLLRAFPEDSDLEKLTDTGPLQLHVQQRGLEIVDRRNML